MALNLITVNVASAKHVSIPLQVQQAAASRRDSSGVTCRRSIRKGDAIIVGKGDMSAPVDGEVLNDPLRIDGAQGMSLVAEVVLDILARSQILDDGDAARLAGRIDREGGLVADAQGKATVVRRRVRVPLIPRAVGVVAIHSNTGVASSEACQDLTSS